MSEAPTGLIAAAFTPMDPGGKVDKARIPSVVDHLVSDGVNGLFVCGSTGEGVLLTSAERRVVAEAYVEAARERLPVMVHVGHDAPREAAELAAHAEGLGVAAIAAAPPTYFRPASIQALVGCYEEIAAGAPNTPLYAYHIPVRSGTDLPMHEFLAQAAARIPTLAGLKFTAPDIPMLQACLAHEDGRFRVYFGVDQMLLSALVVGVQGAIGSTYNYAAPLYRRVWEACARGDLVSARAEQFRAAQMVAIMHRFRGLPAGKAMMKLIGVDCGPCRTPLETLSAAECAALERELRALGFFEWARPCVAV